jgi:hypothetical protein
MQDYNPLDRKSGILAYESGFDFIRVRFTDNEEYIYTYASAGANHVEKMKVLASRGSGLDKYINTHVSESYERKEA